MAMRKKAVKTGTVKTGSVKTATVKKRTSKTPARTSVAKASAAMARVAPRTVSRTAPQPTTTRKAPQSAPYEEGKWAHVFAPRAAGERRYWLVKSEPDVFSFDDLRAAPQQTTCWDSVRNTAARNFMRDGMRRGDLAFYYHSNAEPSAIVGICEIVREGYPDHTAFDPSHDYYDPKSVRETPTWFMVDVRAVEPLRRPVTLPELKALPALQHMALLKVGRLSVVPVTADEWELVLALSR